MNDFKGKNLDEGKWCTKPMECFICTHTWVAVYSIECTVLECPNCKHLNDINHEQRKELS